MLTSLILSCMLATKSPIEITKQHFVQRAGDWIIFLEFSSNQKQYIKGNEVAIAVDGWVSNSSATPSKGQNLNWSTHGLSLHSNPSVKGLAVDEYKVIKDVHDNERCTEKMIVKISKVPINNVEDIDKDKPTPFLDSLDLAEDETFYIAVRLCHQHFMYGPYQPLLGRRSLHVQFGDFKLPEATVDLSREIYTVQAETKFLTPPEDRLDKTFFLSSPDSLQLEAHIQGNQRYRFPEMPVRAGQKMRLRYSYLIALESEGEFRVRIAQYQDSPSGWKVLHEGAKEFIENPIFIVKSIKSSKFIEPSKHIKWETVERIIKMEPDATSFALEFLLYGTERGIVWIDNISFTPVNERINP